MARPGGRRHASCDETLSGYSDEGMSVYSYPRYGTAQESFLTLSAGGVTVGSNLSARGSLWSWTWNGLQS